MGLRLNWEKRYITLGPIATLLGLAFKAYDPDHLLGSEEELGITCALIPTNTAGIEIGRRHFPLNMAFQNGPNSGKDVFIPMDWVIGGEAGLGEGWRMLMESLSAGRGISLPALSSAGAKQASRMTGAYARVRKQFHLPIGYFEGVEEVLARMGGLTYLMDAARTLTTSALDEGERPSVVTAILKYNLTELMRGIVNDAMDIHGGRGICLGPSNYLGRTYQSVPISITVEGANILTRTMIIFGQGALRCHPWLVKEMEAAHLEDEQKALILFDEALTGHLAYSTRNLMRAFVFGVSRERLAEGGGKVKLARYYRSLTRFSAAFSVLADLGLATLGGQLKRREKLSGRYADVLSHLYLSSAVLKRFKDDGELDTDLPLAQWALDYSLSQIEVSLAEIMRHFPVKWMRLPLRWWLMPLGAMHRPPMDGLGHRVARILLKPSEVRERLTHGIFKSEAADDITGRIEHALHLTLQVEPLEKRLREDGEARDFSESNDEWFQRLLKTKVITDEEFDRLTQANIAVRNAIMVDDFEPDLKRSSSQDLPLDARAQKSQVEVEKTHSGEHSHDEAA